MAVYSAVLQLVAAVSSLTFVGFDIMLLSALARAMDGAPTPCAP